MTNLDAQVPGETGPDTEGCPVLAWAEGSPGQQVTPSELLSLCPKMLEKGDYVTNPGI